MFSKLVRFIKTTVGKIVTGLIGLAALLPLVDYWLQWNLYDKLTNLIGSIVIPFLLQRIEMPIYVAMVMGACSILCFWMGLLKLYKPKEFYIEIKDKYYTDHPPSDYDRRTKWNFKNYKRYYFIPLLSHSYDSVSYVECCGPYCAKCDHILHLKGRSGGNLGHTFECINCNRKYCIPRELRGDYVEKLDQYFTEEMRQGRLKQNN